MKISKTRLKEIVREELAEFKSFPKSSKALPGKDVVWRIKNSPDKRYKDFFGKKALDAIAKISKLTAKDLDELLPDYVPGDLIYNLWNEDEVNEMRPHVSKHLPGEAVWQHIEDNLDWEMYIGRGGMKELEKELKRMKKVTSQQLDQMVPGFIPGDEVYGVFKNHLAIGPTE